MGKAKQYPVIRTVLLGVSFTGKTSLCMRFVNRHFEWVYQSTEQISTYRSIITLTDSDGEKRHILLQIEDVFPINHPDLQGEGGIDGKNQDLDKILDNPIPEESMTAETYAYLSRPIHCYVYVFDKSERSSFEEVQRLAEYVYKREDRVIGRKKQVKPIKFLVANKADLDPFHGAENEARRAAKKFGLIYSETSAVTNTGVEDLFLDIAKAVMASGIFKSKEEEEERKRREHQEQSFWASLTTLCGCGGRSEKKEVRDEEAEDEEEKPQEEEQPSNSKCTLQYLESLTTTPVSAGTVPSLVLPLPPQYAAGTSAFEW